MVTPELISYIKNQIRKNISKNTISSTLTKTGWQLKDIEDGFLEVTKTFIVTNPANKNQKSNQPKKDIYRESTKKEIPEKTHFTPPPSEDKKTIPENWPSPPTQTIVKSKPKATINTKTSNTPVISTFNTQTSSTKVENSELIPELVPKINTTPALNKKNQDKTNAPETFFSDDSKGSLPRKAMMASFPKDLLTANKSTKSKPLKRKKFFLWKWILFLLLPIIIITGTFLVFKKVNIKLSEIKIKIPFMDGNAKDILLNSPNILSSLLSYKTETEINIDLPSLTNLGSRNSMQINITGMVNQKGLPTSSCDNVINIQSSAFEGSFVTNLKSTGPILFISSPELNQFTVGKNQDNGMVAIKEEEVGLIEPLLADNYQERIKKMNIQKFLLKNMFAYLNNDIIEFYKEYIDDLSIKKGKTEKIQGVETYHYDLNVNLTMTQKLLTQISNIFARDFLEKSETEGIDNSIDIDSFDVWIDKRNNDYFKFKIVFSIPFSKISKPSDNYTGNERAEFEWQTIYYDFGIFNKIELPQKIISVEEFVRGIQRN